MKPSTLRTSLILVLLIGGGVILGSVFEIAKAQEDLPLPIQVLQATLGQLVPADTPVGHIDGLSFLDADLSKDETVHGMAFSYSEDDLPGAWIANYKVISEHPTGTGNMDIPLSQSCENRVQINIINRQQAPAEAILAADEEFLNLSISEMATAGFSSPSIVSEFEKFDLDAGNYIGTQSFHDLDLHFIRIPLFEEALDPDILEPTNMIQGYRTLLIWGDGDWIFMVRDHAEMQEYYQLFVDGENMGNRDHYQDTCPISRHPQIDAFQWAETLYRTYKDAGLLTGQVPTPPVTYNVACSLRPEIGQPLVLEADFNDGEGNYLKNQPIWITGDGELGRLIQIDNPMTSGKDWVAPGSTSLLAETNPNGRMVLPAAVALNQAMTPISPLNPMTGGLTFTMPGPEGTTIHLGRCDLSIDYIAMTNSYSGAVGLDSAGDDLPIYCLTELGMSGKPLAPKFQTFTSGDTLLIGSCGTSGSIGSTDGKIMLEYIDNSAVMIEYILPKIYNLLDHPPFGEYIIGHNTLGPKISAENRSIFTFGINKVVEEIASESMEFAIHLVFKRGLGPVTGVITELVGNYAADEYAPLTFSEKNTQALRVIRLRSLVEFSYEHPVGEMRMRTFEGNPEIFSPETNTAVGLTAGQETKPFDENPVVTDFDMAAAETWWESPEWQAANQETGAEVEIGPIENLNQADFRLVLFAGAMCILTFLGGLLLVGLFITIGRQKRSKPTPAVSPDMLPNGQATPSSKSRGLTCVVVVVVLILLVGCCGIMAYFGRGLIGEVLDTGLTQITEEIPPSNTPDVQILAATLTEFEAAAEIETAAEAVATTTPETPTEVAPTQESFQESVQETSVPAGGALTDEGPWIIFEAEDGLWALNPDGSNLTHLVDEIIVAPTDLEAGISPSGSTLAFVTASDALTLQNLTLKLLKLPEGTVETITRLTSSETEPEAQFDICDPKHEAARAVTIDDGLGWSSDGRQLAFIGSMQGPTADLYVYLRDDGGITRLSNGPSQAYGIQWSNSDETIVHFGASCFGTGAGFNVTGAWAAYADNSNVIDLYTPGPKSYGEQFIANYWGPNDAFYVATISDCPLRDLRLIDINTQEVSPVYAGCFIDYALGATNLIAVLTNQDFSEDPGLYIYEEAGGPIAPVTIPEENGYQVEIHNDLALVEMIDFSQSSSEIRSVDFMNGQAGWYSGSGDFPVFGPVGDHYTWLEGDTFYLDAREKNQPQVLSNQGARYPFWYEEIGSATSNVDQHLLYFVGESSSTLYLASAPDYEPVAIAEGLNPQGTPVQVFSSK